MEEGGQTEFDTGPYNSARDQAETIELVRYWRAIKRHHMMIILLAIAAGVIAMLYVNTLQPIYRGTATVLLDPIRKKSVTNEEIYESNGNTARDYYLTQIELMKSRDYAEQLVKVLHLAGNQEYNPRVSRDKDGWLAALSNVTGQQDAPDRMIARVMAQLNIQAVRNTQLVRISFD